MGEQRYQAVLAVISDGLSVSQVAEKVGVSTKDPAFPDTYYLGRLAAPDTIDTVPEKTLLAFADHGGPVELMKPDYAAAEVYLAKVARHGIDVDALGESLQRQGARAFEADWAALLESIGTKTGNL